ncbi:anti-repressor-like protein [Lactobacillus selangorensis]|uniref:Anti-repressor-like protein n=1 Tax=Lactobacillus selangorensis TaxID=81857 RepID=A0A0R2FHK3_9LACO|nr:phage antirepressor [Lactobacillus selangorensis]KRN27726.1 anti-repressor-like protein [Lactobacillus selangorensis]KRN30309.1 anti-repressor-like protein [Lactobacillus selangorensis]
MNELQNFDFKGNQVRTVLIDDEPYFVGKDVTDILGYQNGSRDLNTHVDDEDRLQYQISTSGQMRKQTIINESGLYSLILSSKLPSAKEFKHWVTSEVLPTIRKHGAYMTPDTIEKALTDPDTIIQLATQLKREREGRMLAEQQVNELQPKATYYDLILQSKSLLSVSKISKDYGMSARKFNSLLHEFGVQFRQGDIWLLYAKYQDKGYTQTSSYAIDDSYSRVLTKWTQAGRLFLYQLLKEHDLLPLIEKDGVA